MMVMMIYLSNLMITDVILVIIIMTFDNYSYYYLEMMITMGSMTIKILNRKKDAGTRDRGKTKNITLKKTHQYQIHK